MALKRWRYFRLKFPLLYRGLLLLLMIYRKTKQTAEAICLVERSYEKEVQSFVTFVQYHSNTYQIDFV